MSRARITRQGALSRLIAPQVLLIVAGLIPLFLAWEASPAAYITLWDVRRFVDRSFMAAALALVGALIVGSIVGGRLRLRAWVASGDRPSHASRAARAGRRLLQLAAAGYAILVMVAFLRGLNPGLVIRALSGQRGGINALKRTLQPIAGVTTFNQFAAPGIALVVWAKRVGTPVTELPMRLLKVVALCVALRSTLYAERLALIEVVVPVLIVMILTPSAGRRAVGNRTIMAAAASVVALYPLQEYYRKWLPVYRALYPGSFWEYIRDRLAGYYVTSINNSAIAQYFADLPPGTVSLRVLRESPILSLLPWPGSTAAFPRALAEYGNIEFNNIGGILALRAEVGPLALLVALGYGLFLGVLFRHARKGGPVAVAYGMAAVGVVEIMRIPYVLIPRGFIPTVAAIVAVRWAMQAAETTSVRRRAVVRA